IDLHVHLVEPRPRPRACGLPEERCERLDVLVVEARRKPAYDLLHECRLAPAAILLLTYPPVVLLRPAPGVIGSPHHPWQRTAEDERPGPDRIGRGEERAHRAALREAEQRGPPRADSVHDHAH